MLRGDFQSIPAGNRILEIEHCASAATPRAIVDAICRAHALGMICSASCDCGEPDPHDPVTRQRRSARSANERALPLGSSRQAAGSRVTKSGGHRGRAEPSSGHHDVVLGYSGSRSFVSPFHPVPTNSDRALSQRMWGAEEEDLSADRIRPSVPSRWPGVRRGSNGSNSRQVHCLRGVTVRIEFSVRIG